MADTGTTGAPTDPSKVIITNAPDGVKVTESGVADRVKPYGSIKFPIDPSVMESMFKGYNPDDDPEVVPLQVKQADMYQNAVIHATEGEGDSKHGVGISGNLVVARGLRASKQVAFNGWDQLNAIRATPEFVAQKMRETHGRYVNPNTIRLYESAKAAFVEQFGTDDGFTFGGPTDFAGGMNQPNDEFHPLMLGPYGRNLYLYDFLDQASKAFQAYNHNPILRAGIDHGVNFVIGDGVKVVFANPACQEVWDAWVRGVEDYGLSFQDKLRMLYRDGSIIGEFMPYMPIDPNTGWPILKLRDTTTIWEFVTDPRDIERVFYAYFQYYTQYQYPFQARPAGGSTAAMPPTAEYVIEQLPPSDWLHVKMNSTVGEKRGRSDLFPVLGWGKRFKDWFNAAVVSGQINNAFVLWWQVDGDQGDVDALRTNADFTRVPPPGSAFFTNKAVTPNLLRAEGANQIGNLGEALISVIATGLHLTPEYLGVVGRGAPRASAITRAEPTAKFFEQRQQLVRETVTWMVRRVLAAARKQNVLPTNQPKQASVGELVKAVRGGKFDRARMLVEAMKAKGVYQERLDEDFEVVMADLSPADKSSTLKNYAILASTKVWSQKRYSERAAELMDDDNYDFEDEQDQIRSEAEQNLAVMGTMPPSMAGDGAAAPEPGSGDDEHDYAQQNQDKPA